MKGTKRNEEGVETFRNGTEQVDLSSLDLPARSVEWELDEGSYRLRLEMEGPTSVSVESLEGETIVNARKTDGTAILDLNSEAVRVTAERPIQSLRLERHVSRSKGTVLLGPFEAEGWVSATAKGHGSWTIRVASNQVYDASLDAGSARPSLTKHSGFVWTGAGRESSPSEPAQGLAHDTIVRLDPTKAKDLDFLDEVSAGVVHKDHEEWKIESTTALDHSMYDYWRGLNKTLGLSPDEAPGFDPVYGRWAYVWGIPSGVERAINLANGEEVETPVTTEGAYLVKIAFPEAFEVQGIYTPKGTAVPTSRSTLPPGTHARATRTESPGEVFVEVSGTGLLRGIELTERVPMGPEGMEIAQTREIKIPDGVGEERPEQMMSHHYR